MDEQVMAYDKDANEIISLNILSSCPECGNRLTGIIEIGPRHRWMRDCRKLYRRHRCLLKYVEPGEYDRECFPNRFCVKCGFEWIEQEGRFHKGRYIPAAFDKAEFQEFLEETEFSFEPYLSGQKKKSPFFVRWMKNLWNVFFSRIYRM